MTEVENVAWVAGLFEGEGSIILKGKHSFIVSICMTDLDILERVQAIFGGQIYKLTTRKEHWKQAWRWQIADTAKAYIFLMDIYRFLGSRRKAKADQAINRLEAYREEQNLKVEFRKKILSMYDTGMYTESQIAEALGTNRSYVSAVRCGKLSVAGV